MSKYSRTRKAICRISVLEIWPISRKKFNPLTQRTWKQDYKRYRKFSLKYYGKRTDTTKLRYKDFIKIHPNIWRYIPTWY